MLAVGASTIFCVFYLHLYCIPYTIYRCYMPMGHQVILAQCFQRLFCWFILCCDLTMHDLTCFFSTGADNLSTIFWSTVCVYFCLLFHFRVYLLFLLSTWAFASSFFFLYLFLSLSFSAHCWTFSFKLCDLLRCLWFSHTFFFCLHSGIEMRYAHKSAAMHCLETEIIFYHIQLWCARRFGASVQLLLLFILCPFFSLHTHYGCTMNLRLN